MTKTVLKRTLYLFLIISVCFILQSTLFYRLELGFGHPDIMVIVACSIGFMRKEREGLFAGMYCGLLMDLFSTSLFGYYMLIFIVIGFFCGLFSESYYAEDVKLPIVLITGCDFVYHMYIYTSIYLVRGDLNLKGYFASIILPSLLYTILVSVLLYSGLRFLEKKYDSLERKGRKRVV